MSALHGKPSRRWQEIALDAAIERDPVKLRSLTDELEQALDERDRQEPDPTGNARSQVSRLVSRKKAAENIHRSRVIIEQARRFVAQSQELVGESRRLQEKIAPDHMKSEKKKRCG